ncbi:MAG: type II CAAX prenyl endopeptidase Rce1 family protein [Candidatus Brocadiia bacterium]
MNSGRTRPLLEALLAAAGMVLFALFVRSSLPWSLASDLGLAMTAAAVLLSLYRERTMGGLLGLVPFGRRAALMGLLGVGLGFGFGLLFRWKFDLHWFPGALGRFAPAAAAIGGVEELLYRGYVQGRLNRINGVLGVIGAAAAHTAYKIALFLPPVLGLSSGLSAGGRVDWLVLVFWTFSGGLLFGMLRQAARNVAPALAAHVAFDVVVYGELARAPWWV